MRKHLINLMFMNWVVHALLVILMKLYPAHSEELTTLTGQAETLVEFMYEEEAEIRKQKEKMN